MGWTKRFYHDEICAMTPDFDEAEYFAAFGEDNHETDWRVDHTGYQEFRCHLCDGFGPKEDGHPECHDRERAWYDREPRYFD